MAGKKGRSGPPGHMHSAKHPWRLFWRRKVVKPESRWVLPALDAYVDGLKSDKPDLTNGEARVLELAQISRGVTLLILADCAKHGVIRLVDGEVDLQPAMHALSRFLAVELKALQTLGLKRRAKAIPKLTDLLESASNEAKHEG